MASEPTALAMDRAAILAALPHRPPFLFVDRVIERSPGALVSEWDIPHDLPALSGHYPGHPVLPGVLISEFTFQSAAILFTTPGVRADLTEFIPVLTRIEDARFKQMVGPGETLRAAIETLETVGPARFMKASVTSAGATVARLRFTVALVARNAKG
ncbi:MAG: beta-hydroxyacyl-ACP dehydratase [Planctomycetes bacterium]|nr:beta-hydroxyacyl-ACP dehydratase [Planctomycetota bacterium]